MHNYQEQLSTNVNIYKSLIANWDHIRFDAASIIDAIDNTSPADYHAFEITPSHTLAIPTGCTAVHGYLIYLGPAFPMQLLLIADIYDMQIAGGNFNLPSAAICSIEYKSSILPLAAPATYVNRIDNWQNNKDTWVKNVVASGSMDPKKSIVQVFDIPVTDIQNIMGSNTQAFLALKDSLLDENSIEIVFYQDSTSQFYDITSPRPPYGGTKANYGLLI